MIISQAYRAKVWTRHEFRSALARRVSEEPDYILPIRVDDTEMDGLQPTTGYLRYKEPEDIEKIIRAFSEKVRGVLPRNSVKLTAKWLENLKRINELWDIDCIAFAIDQRYVRCTYEAGMEYRLGVSFGINVTVPRSGFLAPPEQTGINVLGIHQLAVDAQRRLRIVDRWVTSAQAYDAESAVDAISQAKAHLASIRDDHYIRSLRSANSGDVLFTSEVYELDQFSEVII